MTTSLSICLASLLAAWGIFGDKKSAEPDNEARIRAAVSNAVEKSVKEAVASAAAKAAEIAAKEKVDQAAKEAAEKAEREAKEAKEKAAKEEAKAEAKEAREIAKEEREIAKQARELAEKTEADRKAAQLEDLRRIESHIFRLEHASAEEVAEKFNTMWSGDFGVNWKITKMAVAFPESNSIMMTAPKAIIMACEQSLKELDVEAPQVYIEARFVELGNTASHKIGIDWSMLGGMSGTATLGGGMQGYNLGRGVQEYSRSVSTKNDGTTSYKIVGGGTKDDNGNIIGDSDGSITYFNGTLNFSQMALTLKALDSTEDAKTFSNPKIIVSSGKKATVDMTTKYPNVKISAKRTEASASTSLDIASNMEAIPGEDKFMFAKESFFSWGISLDVTPRIGTNGLINVAIVPTISSRSDWVETGTSDDSSGTVSSKYPVIDVQRLVTEFNLESGTTAVIGGLSITNERQVDNGIPLLRDIPWLGPRFFGSLERVKEQKEIIVFVTVGLVNPKRIEADAGLPKNAILGRQYIKGQKLEPGDRPEKNMEGIESLDMRPLEEQAKDPLRTQTDFTLKDYIPFRKNADDGKNKE